ncbi:MAG: hypothetical protein QW292_12005 [Candidatus Parvarchaeota archaeon]
MVRLGESYIQYDGKIYVEEVTYEVLNKVPVAAIKLKVRVGIEPGRNQDQIDQPVNPHVHQVGYRVEDAEVTLSFNNIPITHSFQGFVSADPWVIADLSFILRIPFEDLKEIESKRSDDLTLILILQGAVFPHPVGSDLRIGESQKFTIAIQWKFSQKEWVKFLSDIGYGEKWIVEVDRPLLEGFHEIIDHLEKAKDALYNKARPEDVLRDLRAARDSFKTFYAENRDKIEEIIDRGSQGEPGQEPKSKRIDSIYEKISNFLNIGPHNDKYRVTYSDALLAYREFVSILSYISEVMKEAVEKDEEAKK